MPGINICISSNSIDKSNRAKFDKIQENMLHFQSYSKRLILNKDHILIGLTAYECYPIETFEDDNFVITIEGIIYNKENSYIRKLLFEMAAKLSKDEKNSSNKLKKFLINSDGEFIIIIYEKINNRLFFINDLMGRLPVYYHKSDNSLFISREIKFIIPFLTSITINKSALMEYLLYGFPFAKNTLIHGINILRPATIIKYDSLNGDFSEKTICDINLDKTGRIANKESEIDELKKIFLDGLNDRIQKVNDRKPIISLSGGLDSRATLAGLTSLKVKPEAITTVENESNEDSYAKSLAKEFKINITPINVENKLDIENYKRIVFLKDGLNSTGLTIMLDTLDQMMSKYGNDVIMYTGLFGGELLRFVPLKIKFNSINKLTKYLLTIGEGYKYSTNKVMKMLDIRYEDIFNHLQEHLSDFNERNIDKKYVRFRLEYYQRWTNEGEDRNRFFFWTITPFYTNSIFDYAMSMKENSKNHLFFRNFLFALDPRTCNVDFYNYRDVIKQYVQIINFEIFGNDDPISKK